VKISEIGGEFALIRRLAERVSSGSPVRDPAVVQGIGDDCAVLEYAGGRYLLVTTDMLVENVHFTLSSHTPGQVGRKLAESNVSDILAMGGTPRHAFLACSLKPDTEVEFVDALVDGLAASFRRHGVQLLGGDTTRGGEYAFNLTLLGEVERDLLRLRSAAVPGDLLCTTGTLGGNAAGLELFRRGVEGYRQDFLEPRARTAEEARAIARQARAMIDVSDGLASETGHICACSRVGAEIELERVPISPHTRESARRLGLDPLELALYGGEDYQLLFTLPPENLAALRDGFADFTVIGRVLPEEAGLRLLRGGHAEQPRRGWDHFR
jgi:thiamine-monophosphate kinase